MKSHSQSCQRREWRRALAYRRHKGKHTADVRDQCCDSAREIVFDELRIAAVKSRSRGTRLARSRRARALVPTGGPTQL
jgi:hypothetical protein